MRTTGMLRATGTMAGPRSAAGDADGGGQSAPHGDAARRIVGTWRLVSITAGGGVEPNRGAHPTGQVHYAANGCLSLQIMPDRSRPKYAGASPTPEEAKAAIIGYSAYFGRYSVDERAGTVTHHRMGNILPGGLGDLVRRFELLPGDRLVLRPVEPENANQALTWERIP